MKLEPYGELKPAHADLEHRRPVWIALSDLFLDTDTSLSRSWRVEILAESPYSIDELEKILADEVYPVCRWNLINPAGEWADFDLKRLEQSILQPRPSFYRWCGFNFGRFTMRFSSEWIYTKKNVIQCRA